MAPLALFNEGVPAHFFHLIQVPTMRLLNVKVLLRWPSRMHIYGSAGPFQSGGTRPFSNIMAPLALFNEGVPAHFFHLMEVPMIRLPNIKILLCWSSGMHIYGFV